MLDKLMSGTVGFVQDNLTMIGNSYPVTFMNEKVRDMIGWKKSEETEEIDHELITDTFNDSPTSKPGDYISIYSMFDRTFKGERLSFYRWFLCLVGIFITGFVILMVTNNMIMLPMSVRLFITLYILNLGLYTDFTRLNMIYYILFGYFGIFLYRAYLRTMDPNVLIVPFYTYGYLPLRTAKGNWTDSINSFWLYLHGGAGGQDYNEIVRSTEDYMIAQKASFPDYDALEKQFNLKPLYDKFEDHLININLPGFIPPPPPVSPANLGQAKDTVGAAKKITTVISAKGVMDAAKKVLGMTSGPIGKQASQSSQAVPPIQTPPPSKPPSMNKIVETEQSVTGTANNIGSTNLVSHWYNN
jgi:hypothetical protein